MPGSLWMFIFHELELDTMPAEDIPDFIGKLPAWVCAMIPILLFVAAFVIGMIPFIL